MLLFLTRRPSDSAIKTAGRLRPAWARSPGSIINASRHRRPAIRAADLGMLSTLRFLIGAILASATIMVSALGLLSIVKLGQITTAGPTEVSRNLSFDDRTDWNQFYDADSGWRFEQLARKRVNVEPEQTSVLAPAGASDPAAAEVFVEPAVEDQSDEHAELSARKSPLASTMESKAPTDDDSGVSAAPPASMPSMSASLPDVVAPAELATAIVGATAPAALIAVVATTAAAPSEPREPEPLAARIATGVPERGEETPLPAQSGVVSIEERHTIVPVTAGSANARHVEPPRVLPGSPRAAAPDVERATPTRPRKTTQKSRRPGEDRRARPHLAKRPHVHASRSVPREQYPNALPSWQPY